MSEDFLKAAKLLEAGYSFWDALPLLRKLPRAVSLHDFERSVVIEWSHPSNEIDIRHRAELIRGAEALSADSKELCEKLAFALREWAESPAQIPRSEFRNKAVQELANFIDSRDGSQKELARAFYRTFSPTQKREKVRDAGGEAQAIEAITKQIQYISRARRGKS